MRQPDPLAAYKYAVEIEGIAQALFTECKGLAVEWETLKFKEGGVNNFEHQFPTRIKSSKITLKHGMANTQDLWNWMIAGTTTGKVKYTNMSIILRHPTGQEARRWNLTRAYPLAWKGGDLKSDSKNTVIETLEIAFHGIAMEETSAG
jgi:phage tail-like protein